MRYVAVQFLFFLGGYALENSVIPLGARQDQCIPGTMTGKKYCPMCEGISAAVPNMFILCQDKSDKKSDDENHASQEKNGECRSYHPQYSDEVREQEQSKCQRSCVAKNKNPEEGAVAACDGFQAATGISQIDNNFFYTFRDALGRYYEPATCNCNLKLPGLILDIVLEGIAKAMEVIGPILFIACKLFMTVLEVVSTPFLTDESAWQLIRLSL
jgi:hypothetical protein